MSNVALFTVGFFVTLIVVAALSLLFWGAVLDGREEEERRAERERARAGVTSVESVGADVVRLAAARGGSDAKSRKTLAEPPLTRGAA